MYPQFYQHHWISPLSLMSTKDLLEISVDQLVLDTSKIVLSAVCFGDDRRKNVKRTTLAFLLEVKG